MNDHGFIGYIGDPDIHDGHIRALEFSSQKTKVTIESYIGKSFTIEFHDVAWLKSEHPIGMMLYALAEWRGEGKSRRFIFANWDEEDDAYLEIGAAGFEIIKEEG